MNPPVNRHDFLKAVARGGLLLGLGAAGAAALHGRHNSSACAGMDECACCATYSTCTLPQRKRASHGEGEKG